MLGTMGKKSKQESIDHAPCSADVCDGLLEPSKKKKTVCSATEQLEEVLTKKHKTTRSKDTRVPDEVDVPAADEHVIDVVGKSKKKKRVDVSDPSGLDVGHPKKMEKISKGKIVTTQVVAISNVGDVPENETQQKRAKKEKKDRSHRSELLDTDKHQTDDRPPSDNRCIDPAESVETNDVTQRKKSKKSKKADPDVGNDKQKVEAGEENMTDKLSVLMTDEGPSKKRKSKKSKNSQIDLEQPKNVNKRSETKEVSEGKGKGDKGKEIVDCQTVDDSITISKTKKKRSTADDILCQKTEDVEDLFVSGVKRIRKRSKKNAEERSHQNDIDPNVYRVSVEDGKDLDGLKNDCEVELKSVEKRSKTVSKGKKKVDKPTVSDEKKVSDVQLETESTIEADNLPSKKHKKKKKSSEQNDEYVETKADVKLSDLNEIQQNVVAQDEKVSHHQDLGPELLKVKRKRGKEESQALDLHGSEAIAEETNALMKDKKRKRQKLSENNTDKEAEHHSTDTSIRTMMQSDNNTDQSKKQLNVVLENELVLESKRKNKRSKKTRDLTASDEIEEPANVVEADLKANRKKKQKHKSDEPVNGDDAIGGGCVDKTATTAAAAKKSRTRNCNLDNGNFQTAVNPIVDVVNENEVSSTTPVAQPKEANGAALQSKCYLGQWASAELDAAERMPKFMRLLGGMKNKSNNLGPFGLRNGDRPAPVTGAMSKSEQEQLNKSLEQQFNQAQQLKFNKQQRGGLGFEPAPDAGKKLYIDAGMVRSKKFDD